MIKLHKFCALLLTLSLVACDKDTQKTTADVKPIANSNQAQTFNPIDLQTAKQFETPTDFAGLSTLADQYFEARQYLKAIQTYDQAIALNPMCADCYNDRGLSSFYLGNLGPALEALDKATTINPAYSHAWLSKGFVLMSAGRYTEAIAPLHKVKEIEATGTLVAEADKFLAMIAEKTAQQAN